MKVWRMVKSGLIGLYVFLKGIFLMATGMCILAGGFVGFPIAVNNLDKGLLSWQPETGFLSGWFNWFSLTLFDCGATIFLLLCVVWSVVFMFKGVKALKREEQK